MDGNISQSNGLLKVPFNVGMRRLFYAVTPSESSFEKIEDVPNYVLLAAPFFFTLIFIEFIAAHLKGVNKPRLNDSYSSLSAGLISQLPLLIMKNIELGAYIYIYNHYNLIQLPWDHPATWWLAMLGVDLGYYWVHRCAHEVNFMWAAHQVHHSSEDYNLITALRQSVLQRFSSWIFYLPMALFIPPSVFLVHIQFNLLYQFWIHTEVIRTIGPLEYILNTPSHHRVHHGRNRYCIDKNYAGVLIIWDRMFGTFAPEEEKVIYGLVHPLGSWDPIYIQLCHWKYMLTSFMNFEGIKNKIAFFWNGPGWAPGKPRLGEIEDIPEIDVNNPGPKYNKSVSILLNIYTWFNFITVLVAQSELGFKREFFSQWSMLLIILFLMWTLTNIGYFYEHKWFAAPLEALRCLVYIFADSFICSHNDCPLAMSGLRLYYLMSFMFWCTQTAQSLAPNTKKID